MNNLTDDCQFLIIKLLTLKDQLQLYGAYEVYGTSRIVTNLLQKWQKQKQFKFDKELFDTFNKKPYLFHILLSTICENVREVIMDGVTMAELERWTLYKFPRTTTLEYTVRINQEFTSVIQMMAKIFPELESFKPAGTFDLIHLRNWTKLRKLNLLNSCPRSETPDSAKGVENLQMVEDLEIRTKKLNEEHFKMLCKLPKLQRLVIRGTRKYLRTVTDEHALNIEKINLRKSYWHERKYLLKLTNLRELCLQQSEYLSIDELQEILAALPKLNRLIVNGFPLFPSKNSILKTIGCCPSLAVAYVSYPPCSVINGKLTYYDNYQAIPQQYFNYVYMAEYEFNNKLK